MSTSLSGLSGNFFPSPQNGFTTTTAGSVASGAATVTLNSVSGYSNGQIATFVIDPTDAAKKQTFTGVVDTSGVQITSVVWTAGTNQTHALGATVVDYATATHIGQITKGILIAHEQTGIHKSGATYPNPTLTGTTTSAGIVNTGAFTQTGTTALNGSWDGWVGANESWTYASATTITVPTDATTKYDIGDFIKITQSATVKYFVIMSLTSTVLTVSGLAGATVANSAITANAYAKSRNPFGNGLKGGIPYNPYKFRASLNAATNTGNGAYSTAIPFDTEQFDTGSNLASGVFTAPIGGFYQFNWNVQATLSAGADETLVASLFINGTETSRGSLISYRNGEGSHGSDIVQMTSGQTADIRAFNTTTRALAVGNIYSTYFSGFLVSAL